MTDPIRDRSMTDVPDKPVWTDDELRTLIGFRKRYGRRWKSRLLDLYLFGKDDREPDGPGLRHIRNRQGPSRVHALKTSVLDAAEARFILGNFVNRVTALIDRNFPDGLPAGFTPDRVLLGECRNRIDKIGEAVRLHRMRQAVAALRALWILANEYVATSKPWSLVKEDRAGAVDVLKNCLLLLRAIAATSAPIIPAIAVKIGAVIELREPNDIKWADALDRTWLDGEVRISAIPPLFTKITDAEVKALDQEFAGRH